MTGDAVREIAQLAQDAMPRVIDLPGDPQRGYLLRQPDGSYERVAPDLAPVATQCFDTDALVGLLGDGPGERLILVGEDSVVGILDLEGVRTRHTLRLPKHPAHQLLAEHLKTIAYSQKALVRLLRSRLAGFVEPSFIESVRALKLSSSSDGEAVLAQGGEHLSRSIRQQVETRGGGAIPESFVVTAPVFDLREYRDQLEPVTVIVDCQPDKDGQPTFELTTIYSELAEARDTALHSLLIDLAEKAPQAAVRRAAPLP